MIDSDKPKNFHFYQVKNACLVIGITSLAIFALNILALVLSADLYSVTWRVNFLEQIGNRSIALLFGFGLILYGFSAEPKLLNKAAFCCLMSGVFFQIACLLVINDTLILQQRAVINIKRQSQQLKAEIKKEQNRFNPQELKKTLQDIDIQQKELESRAKSEITSGGIVTLGNLFIPGIGLIGLGWLGLKRR